MTSPNAQEGGKHTPGPWQIEGRRGAGYIISAGTNAERDGPADYVGVLDPMFYVAGERADELAANARLAAAAPALLEALRGAIGALEFSRDYHSDLGNEEQAFCQDKLDAALKAITQATGGENGR